MKKTKSMKPSKKCSPVPVKNAVSRDSIEEALEKLEDKLSDVEDAYESPPRRIATLASQLITSLRNFKATLKNMPSPTIGRLESALECANAVLAHTITELAEINSLQQSYFKKALMTYVPYATDYGEVLGELLSQKLRVAAAPRVALCKYRDGTNPTAREDWDVFIKEFQKAKKTFSTGLPTLDNALGGGLHGFTLVGADEGDGKTSLCVMLMVHALRADPRLACVYFTVDQSKKKTLAKLLSFVSGLSSKIIRRDRKDRSAEDNKRFDNAVDELENDLLPRIKFIERTNLPSGPRGLFDTIRQHDTELSSVSGAQQVLLIIDMFQTLVQIFQSAGTTNEMDEHCLDAIKQYMLWSRNKRSPDGSPVIAVSEVRKVERAELGSNDLKGSARLGSVPDNILLLWPTKGTEQTGKTVSRSLKVAKSRDGDEGVIQVQFHHKISLFTEAPLCSKSQVKSGTQKSARRSSRRSNGRSL